MQPDRRMTLKRPDKAREARMQTRPIEYFIPGANVDSILVKCVSLHNPTFLYIKEEGKSLYYYYYHYYTHDRKTVLKILAVDYFNFLNITQSAYRTAHKGSLTLLYSLQSLPQRIRARSPASPSCHHPSPLHYRQYCGISPAYGKACGVFFLPHFSRLSFYPEALVKMHVCHLGD